MTESSLAIEATGLVKVFGDTRAVDGVDLAVRSGSVYGVLGPNGAGKTTTIRMLATLLRPDEGTARVLGHDIVEEADAVRSAVTLTGQLKASVGAGAMHVRLLDPQQRPEAERLLSRDLGSVFLEPDPAALSVQCAEADRGAEAIAGLTRAGVRIADFSLGQPSLDEVFLALTGHPAEEEPSAETDAIGEEQPA
jgi:hypothetical protein